MSSGHFITSADSKEIALDTLRRVLEGGDSTATVSWRSTRTSYHLRADGDIISEKSTGTKVLSRDNSPTSPMKDQIKFRKDNKPEASSPLRLWIDLVKIDFDLRHNQLGHHWDNKSSGGRHFVDFFRDAVASGLVILHNEEVEELVGDFPDLPSLSAFVDGTSRRSWVDVCAEDAATADAAPPPVNAEEQAPPAPSAPLGSDEAAVPRPSSPISGSPDSASSSSDSHSSSSSSTLPGLGLASGAGHDAAAPSALAASEEDEITRADQRRIDELVEEGIRKRMPEIVAAVTRQLEAYLLLKLEQQLKAAEG